VMCFVLFLCVFFVVYVEGYRKAGD
jgi:hypothetical protein